MSNPTISLPAPTELTRQVGVSEMGSPMTLSRGSSEVSNQSYIQTQDQRMLNQLVVYKVYLEHEVEFVNTEIQALINRVPNEESALEASFLQLREDLKVRYTTLQNRLRKVKELLDLM